MSIIGSTMRSLILACISIAKSMQTWTLCAWEITIIPYYGSSWLYVDSFEMQLNILSFQFTQVPFMSALSSCMHIMNINKNNNNNNHNNNNGQVVCACAQGLKPIHWCHDKWPTHVGAGARHTSIGRRTRGGLPSGAARSSPRHD